MSDRSYTKEQEVIVEKILKHKAHEYYKILEIEKTSTEGEIKKAYRKISLKVHPDKNGHPKADECFKRVNKAFEILGDSSKKRIFDQTGADPDSRFGGASSGASSGFGAHPGFQGHPGFNFNGFQGQPGFNFNGFQAGGPNVFQADDLFDILFGGAGGAGGSTFSFGGPGGVRFTTAGGNPFGGFQQRRPQNAGTQGQQQRQANQEPLSSFEVLKQLAPVLIVIALPLISNLFFGSEGVDNFQLQKNYKYSNELITSRINVPYYVTSKTKTNLTPKKLIKLEHAVEEEYVGNLRTNCQYERNEKERHINDAYGWFFPDEEKLSRAQALRLPNCEKLEEIAARLI